jgi:hypothetical protein
MILNAHPAKHARRAYKYQCCNDTRTCPIRSRRGFNQSGIVMTATSGIWISLTRPTSCVRKGGRNGNKISKSDEYGRHGCHLLTNTKRSIPFPAVPAQSARSTVSTTNALLCGCHRGWLEIGHDSVVGVGRHLYGRCHPSSKVGFETKHIGGTFERRLAGDFVGNALRFGKEDLESTIQQAICTLFPDCAAVGLYLLEIAGNLVSQKAYIVVHIGCSQ